MAEKLSLKSSLSPAVPPQVILSPRSDANQEEDLAPGWVTETIVIWTQFPKRKGVLDLSNRNLRRFPKELFSIRHLESLCMKSNKLKEIPDDLSKLAEAGLLKSIDCSHNYIKTVTTKLHEIKSLEKINLSNNKLGQIPDCIPKLSDLSHLDLSNNGISVIPESLFSLLFLENLNLSHNEISTIPPGIVNQGSLKVIDLSHNLIEELPLGIEKFKRLTVLKLNNNKLKSLRDDVGFLITLDELNIEENPFTDQIEIIENDLLSKNKILLYLRNRIRMQDHLRVLLFTEKDNHNNTRWTRPSDESKPQLEGATIEKLVVYLTQVGTPGKKKKMKAKKKKKILFTFCKLVTFFLLI